MLRKNHKPGAEKTKPLTQRGIFNSLPVENQRVARLVGRSVWSELQLLTSGLLVLVGLLVQGCASAPEVVGTQVAKTSGESAVSRRASARWELLIKHDVAGAYEFLSPGSKAANPLDLYKSKIRPLAWRSASVVSAKCEPARCDVQLKLILDLKTQTGVETVISEVWVLDSGEWWVVFTG